MAKIAFYKGRKRIFNRFVSWYLRGKYSHCELVLETVDGISLCASSSLMDGGVRSKWIKLDPAHWDIVNSSRPHRDVEEWLKNHEDQRYDLLGLLGFIWRRQTGSQSRWFCSEAVAAMLGIEEPWRFDPMTLYFALKRKGQ